MNNKPDCSSPFKLTSGKRNALDPQLQHLMKRIEFFTNELKVLENCDNLDTTVIGTVEEYDAMRKKDLENFVKSAHKRSIWKQEKQLKNGRVKTLWLTKLDNNRQISAATKFGLYEKIFDYYADGNAFLFDRKYHTLAFLFPKFLKEYKAYENVSGKTLQEYQQKWDRYYAGQPITKRCIEDITTAEWKHFFQAMIRDNNLTKTAFSDIRTIANGLFEYSIELGFIDHSRIRDLNYRRFPFADEPVYNCIRAEAFTAEQLEEVRSWCYREMANPRKKAIYPCAIILNSYIGLRFAELAALAWEDIDFENSVIFVHSQLVSDVEMVGDSFVDHGKKIVDRLKSHEKPRLVPLLPEGIEILQRIKALHLDDKLVFPPGNFRYKTYNDKIKNAAEAIGLSPKDFHTHCLRASAATSMYIYTKDIRLVQALLGHTTPEMSAKYVKDWRGADDLRKALEQVQAAQKRPRLTLVS